jgi:hypothetical protein
MRRFGIGEKFFAASMRFAPLRHKDLRYGVKRVARFGSAHGADVNARVNPRFPAALASRVCSLGGIRAWQARRRPYLGGKCSFPPSPRLLPA